MSLTAEQHLGRLGDFAVDNAVTLLIGPAIMLGFHQLIGGVPHDHLTPSLPGIVSALIDGLNPAYRRLAPRTNRHSPVPLRIWRRIPIQAISQNHRIE